MLRVLVTAANVGEREGGKQVLKRVKQSQKQVSRLTTLWVDGGNDYEPFMQWVMNFCRWIVQVVLRPEQTFMFCLAQKTLGGGAHFRLDHGVSAIGQQTLSYCRKHQRRLSTLP
uniref:Transposase n=1 Tax=Nostoc flagelliforme str. Sunitezuoqi TaxID=676037 RepID=E7DQ17_9NOSO|nr:transposase [Nostoc flagelliforme str. Sunitezuoqi]